MKNLKVVFLMIFALVSFSLYGSSVLANTQVTSNHTWIVDFPNNIDAKSVGEYNVVVFDNYYISEEGISVSVNKNVITIKAPKNGYNSERDYTLRFSEIKTTDGKLHNKEIKFGIKDKVTSEKAIVVNPKVTNISGNVVIPEQSKDYFKVIKLAKDKEKVSLQWVKKALAKYPKYLVNENLDNVYISKIISIDDIKFGGTYRDNDIYISNDEYTFTNFERLLHAEFSSVLLNNYPKNFKEKEWLALNPKGFSYSDEEDGGINYLATLVDGKYDNSRDKDYIKYGFLTEYATSSLENDFNAIAKAMFSGDKTLWNNIDGNYALNKKLELAITFYNKLDPMFTKEYFRNL